MCLFSFKSGFFHSAYLEIHLCRGMLLHSSFLLTSVPLYGYTTVLLLHSPVDEYLRCLYLLAIKNEATKNLCLTIFEHGLFLLGNPRSVMPGLYSRYMFNFLIN